MARIGQTAYPPLQKAKSIDEFLSAGYQLCQELQEEEPANLKKGRYTSAGALYVDVWRVLKEEEKRIQEVPNDRRQMLQYGEDA